MTSSYPRSLSSFVQRISNYSTNTFKLIPYRTDSIGSSSIIVVDLPSNALCDLDSFCMSFKLTTTCSGGYFAVPPKHIESLISKIVVEVNGSTLGSCTNLGYVYNMLLQYQNGGDLRGKRKLYQNGDGVAATPTANITSVPYKIHQFLGFLNSAKPEILDTALTGNVRVHIYLESTNALIVSNVAGVPTYTLDSCYFTINTLSIDDNIYYNLHNEFLLSGGVYSVPFQTIYTALFSVTTTTQSARFSVNSQSVDMIMGAFFPNYDTKSLVNTSTKTSDVYTKYGTNITAWNYELNGIQMPSFSADADDAFPLSLNALGLSQDVLGGIDEDCSTVALYKSSYFCPVVRLCHNTDPDERYITGFNTKNQSCNIVYKTTGGAQAAQLLVAVFCTSTMQISSGRTISIIS